MEKGEERKEGLGGWQPLSCAQPWAEMWMLKPGGEQPGQLLHAIFQQSMAAAVCHWAARY